VRVPLKRTDVNATFVAGMGVLPDIDATEDVSDLRAGRDRALRVAIRQPWTDPRDLRRAGQHDLRDRK
jgi:hypothetical protein